MLKEKYRKRLVIAIPTYNRSYFLGLLLESIYFQLTNINLPVGVVVYDNNSTDDTSDVVDRFKNQGWQLEYIKNEDNIGADRNIAKAFIDSNGDYVWIVGDDDILLPGSIESIIKLIGKKNPALIFMRCVGFSGDYQVSKRRIASIKYLSLGKMEFLKRVNVYLTFISAIVINKRIFLENYHDDVVSELFGTNLVQLGWVLPSIELDAPLIYVSTTLVAGRNENRGGYDEFRVFVTNLNHIFSNFYCQNKNIASMVMNYIIRQHYTYLLASDRPDWGSFPKENRREVLLNSCGKNFRFWIFLYPLLKLKGRSKVIYFILIRLTNYTLRLPLSLKMKILSKKLKI